MSNILLVQVAHNYAEENLPKLIKMYNDPQLTELGRKEILSSFIMNTYMAGYLLKEESVLMENIKFKEDEEDEYEDTEDS